MGGGTENKRRERVRGKTERQTLKDLSHVKNRSLNIYLNIWDVKMQHLDFQTCTHQHENRMGNVWREEEGQHDRVRKKGG